MKPYATDISVLLLFFNRADHFSQVWAEVKKARPSRLFLYQDGPREGRDDMPGIQECRALVADDQIDWECEVHRNYQEKNVGCDPAEYLSQRWAFSLTDKCIVLEDDDVPSQSFFPFCKEMLDRYEHDERVTLISGFMVSKRKDDLEAGSSYFFTRAFSIWGWASWARVVNNWEGDYAFLKDPARLALLKQKVAQYGQRNDMVAMCQNHMATGREYYESIFWAYMLLHDGLAIMPSCNLVNNIGMDGGTHYAAQLDLLPKRMRWQFIMPRHEMRFPLVHPDEVTEDKAYQKEYYLLNAWNSPFRKVQYSLEELWLNLRKGNFQQIFKSLKNRILKTLGKKKHS
ncbi:MAG: hemolysin activation protein [Bacteroidaceae bacterium]|nr:hemolysin activation protein [Bacteroidaceae bacterium]